MHSSSVLLHTQQQQQQQIVQGQNNNVLKRGKALGHGLQEDVLGSADGENLENGVESNLFECLCGELSVNSSIFESNLIFNLKICH